MSSISVKNLLYTPKNGTNWENYIIEPFIQSLLDIITKNKQYFLVIANILEKYKNPDFDHETKKSRELDLKSYISLYPQTKDNISENENLISILESLFSLTSQQIGDVRGKFVEAIIYKYGPKNFTETSSTVKCLEPIITFNTSSNIIGGNGCDFDFIYHNDNGKISTIPDYFECKGTIDGMVKLGESMTLLKPKKLIKWHYAKNIADFFYSESSVKPNIFFACLNSNTDDIQQHINQEGYDCVTILNSRDIFRMLI